MINLLGIRMYHTATFTADGFVHVQNFVMGCRGQHHVHSAKGYEDWKKVVQISKSDVSERHGIEKCCDMKPGDVMEYDGQRWHNGKFEEAGS